MITTVWEHVVPSLEHCVVGSDVFTVPRDLRLWCADKTFRVTVETALRAISRISAGERGRRDPRWTMVADRSSAHVVVQRAEVAPTGAANGYRIVVNSAHVTITAGARAGIAAGLATFYQAVLHAVDANANVDADANVDTSAKEDAPPRSVLAQLPAAEISDRPAHEWRGFMIDVARHFFPVESLVRMLDLLWLLRLNRFHLHLTDDQGWRVPIDGYPRLTEVGAWRDDCTSEEGRYGGFYTLEQLVKLDTAAAASGIEIVPEIDLPGHASAAVTAYPQLGCSGIPPGVETRWGIFAAVICPVGDTVTRFIDRVFGVLSELFRGDHLHIGGDEVITTAWEASTVCREYMRDHSLSGTDGLYQTIVRAMADCVLRRGKRPVAWDEASQLDLPAETIIANWRQPHFATSARERGYDIILAPQDRKAYLDHRHLDDPFESGRLGTCTVYDSASFEPYRYALDTKNRKEPVAGRVLGGQANLWTEGITSHRQAEYMALLRLAAISEGLWCGTPGTDRWDAGFSASLERLRTVMFRRGFNVYPGPLCTV